MWDHKVDRHVYSLVEKKQKTVDLSVGAASDVKLDDPVLQGLREASKEITSPVALDICEDEIADLLEALKEAKEAQDKAKAEARARQLHWVNGILTKVVGLPRVLSLRNLY